MTEVKNPNQFQWRPRQKSLARKFVSIAFNTETIHSRAYNVPYAVADDGTAWCMDPIHDEWQQLPALPDRDSELN